jgi:hypothetical protein
LIDHILVTRPLKAIDNSITSGSLFCEIADHLPNFVIINGKNMVKCQHKSRSYSEKNIAKFRSEIGNTNWNDVMSSNDANNSYDLFFNKFLGSFNNCFPLKSKSRKQAKHKSWVTKGLLISIKHKARLYKKYLKKPNDANKIAYKLYKNKLLQLVRT